jgi:hypothetical protein
MLLNNKVLKELKEGEVTPTEVCDYIMSAYPIKAIVEDYVKLVMETPVENAKITVNKEEFEAIVSLFKVRGEKVVDGEVVTETRGRKRKK